MSKVQISIDDDLLNRIDSYADSIYITRSGLISSALVEYLDQREIIQGMKSLSLAVQKLSDSNFSDSEEVIESINNFKTVYNALFNKQ